MQDQGDSSFGCSVRLSLEKGRQEGISQSGLSEETDGKRSCSRKSRNTFHRVIGAGTDCQKGDWTFLLALMIESLVKEGDLMVASSYSNLERVRQYGEYPVYAFASPQHVHKANFDLSLTDDDGVMPKITIDLNFCYDWTDLVERLRGYGVSDLLLTEPLCDGSDASPIPIMSFQLTEGLGTGHFRTDSSRAEWDLSGTSHFRTHLEKVGCNASTQADVTIHAILESQEVLTRHLLVVDDPERREAMLRLFPHHKTRLVSSDESVDYARRQARRLGNFYTAPGKKVSKGHYYRSELYSRVPAYERLWSIAVYGTYEKVIDQALYDLSESLGDRLLAVSRLTDQITDASYESPGREALWDVVNNLNYYVVLQTGIFDNLAWLSAVRYGLPTERKSVVLRYPTRKGTRTPGPLHKCLKGCNEDLFDLIDSFQSTMEVFYPIRDAVQHRLILKGALIKYVDEGWTKVMVFPERDTVAALLNLEEAQFHRINSWGLFPMDQGFCVLDPRTFVGKALSETEVFVERFLKLLNPEELLEGYPTVLSRARS